MRIAVYVDVMNFSPRTYVQSSGPAVPSNEIGRILYFEGGGDRPELGPNVYGLLSEHEQERICRKCGMLGSSGDRGTMVVQIAKKKLEQALKAKSI